MLLGLPSTKQQYWDAHVNTLRAAARRCASFCVDARCCTTFVLIPCYFKALNYPFQYCAYFKAMYILLRCATKYGARPNAMRMQRHSSIITNYRVLGRVDGKHNDLRSGWLPACKMVGGVHAPIRHALLAIQKCILGRRLRLC